MSGAVGAVGAALFTAGGAALGVGGAGTTAGAALGCAVTLGAVVVGGAAS